MNYLKKVKLIYLIFICTICLINNYVFLTFNIAEYSTIKKNIARLYNIIGTKK